MLGLKVSGQCELISIANYLPTSFFTRITSQLVANHGKENSTASQTVGQITMTLVVSWITSECSHASTAVRHPHHMDFIIPTAHCANTAYEGTLFLKWPECLSCHSIHTLTTPVLYTQCESCQNRAFWNHLCCSHSSSDRG